jgi:hypothetical protein
LFGDPSLGLLRELRLRVLVGSIDEIVFEFDCGSRASARTQLIYSTA